MQYGNFPEGFQEKLSKLDTDFDDYIGDIGFVINDKLLQQMADFESPLFRQFKTGTYLLVPQFTKTVQSKKPG